MTSERDAMWDETFCPTEDDINNNNKLLSQDVIDEQMFNEINIESIELDPETQGELDSIVQRWKTD